MIKKALYFLAFAVTLFAAILFLRSSQVKSSSFVINTLKQKDSKFFRWRGVDIHYIDEGSGLPILMVHGLGGSHRNFQKLSHEMKDSFRVIRVDLPGFGLSGFPESDYYYLTMYQDFMIDFINHLGIDSLVLIGNSMGGGISWLTTLNHPDKIKGLVLISAAGYDLQKVKKGVVRFARFGIAQKLFYKGMPMLFTRNTIKRVYYNPSLVSKDDLKKTNLMWNKEGNIHAFFELAHSEDLPDETRIKEIKTPTLILWGANDKLVNVKYADRFKQDIRNSKVVIYNQCGHVPMNEKTLEVKRDIEEFLKSI
jgi:pimeloyl-ACP methyl ester carboxylesterase